MKIAISTTGPNLSDTVDQRFGRCQGFLFYDSDTQSHSYMDNSQNLNANEGAGIQSAQHVIQQQAHALITGHIGPKAFTTLQAGNVNIYLAPEGTVENAIQLFLDHKLEQAQSPDRSGHW